jgi:hypothetical protein
LVRMRTPERNTASLMHNGRSRKLELHDAL